MVIVLAAVAVLISVRDRSSIYGAAAAPQDGSVLVSRIAFGSCTSKGVHDDQAQPIWTEGIIPSKVL